MPELYDPDLKLKVPDFERAVLLARSDKLAFQALLGSEVKATSNPFFWPVETPKDSAVKGYKDGQKHTPGNSVQPDQLQGACQEIREDYAIGWQAQQVETYSRHNNPAYQKKRAMERLLVQREKLLLSAQDMVLPAQDTAPLARGAVNWLRPKPAGGADPQGSGVRVPDDYRTLPGAFFDGYLDALDADAFEDLVATVATYLRDSADFTFFCGNKVKRRMSGWLTKSDADSGAMPVVVQKDGRPFTFNQTVDVFKFDTATVRAIQSYNIAWTLTDGDPAKSVASATTPLAGLLIDPKLWRIRRLAPMQWVPIDDEGQGDSGFYREMVGLCCLNPRANGLVLPTGAITPAGNGG
jgi:hypothetical protein